MEKSNNQNIAYATKGKGTDVIKSVKLNRNKMDKIKEAYFEYLFNESMTPYEEFGWLIDNLNEEARQIIVKSYYENQK
jgi:hypothetical protein